DLHAERQVSFVDRLLPLHPLAVLRHGGDDDLVLHRDWAEVDADAVRRRQRVGELLPVDGDGDPRRVEAGDGREVDHALVLALDMAVAGEHELRVGGCGSYCEERKEEAESTINVAATANNLFAFHRSAGTRIGSLKRS